MLPDDEIETSPPSYMPCTAVRLTAYADDGTPDLDQAVMFRFHEPPVFVFAPRTRQPPLDEPGVGYTMRANPLVGFIAPFAYDDHAVLEALERELRTHWGTKVAVEIWSPTNEHLVVPSWRYRLDVGEYAAIPIRPGHNRHSVGEAMATEQSILWPHLDPEHGAAPIERGTQLRIIETGSPPPAPPSPQPPPDMALDMASDIVPDSPDQPGHRPDTVRRDPPRHQKMSLRRRIERLAHRRGWWYSPTLHFQGLDYGSSRRHTRPPKP